MTTSARAALYLAQHQVEWEGSRLAVFNPNDRPVEDLPVIYGFNNGGEPGWFSAISIAQDGTVLGGHTCSHEGYMPHDLGCLEGSRPDRHRDDYQKHYPDGYRMEWVPSGDRDTHAGFQAALAANKEKETESE